MIGVSLKISDGPCPEEVRGAALASLRAHTLKAYGSLTEEKPFSILAFLEERLVGGLIGKIFWNWLYADIVWVEEEFRRRGVGSEIMRAAEARARQMNLSGIYLWTASWQAPLFYEKLGYTQFTEFRDFPPGHIRFGFRKYLG
jgi:GNAT superfamily N-acetyltransferase